MTILQLLGVQQWRLRGRASSQIVPAHQPEQEVVEIADNTVESFVQAVAIPANLAQDDQVESPLTASLVPSEPETVKSPAVAATEEEVKSPASQIQAPTPKSSSSQKTSPSLAMPILRPAPIPLQDEPSMDLSIDQAPEYDYEPVMDMSDVEPMPDVQAAPEMEPVPDYYAESSAGELSELDWRALQARISDSSICPSCSHERSLLGVGDVLAKWLFVADAPNSQEVEQQQIFVGRAGHLYESILNACGLSREQVYTTTVFKCSPPEDLSLTPTCNSLVHRQIELVQPDVVIAFGEFAAQTVLRANESFDELTKRTNRISQSGPLVIPVHSLSEVLSRPEIKAELWRSLKQAIAVTRDH